MRDTFSFLLSTSHLPASSSFQQLQTQRIDATLNFSHHICRACATPSPSSYRRHMFLLLVVSYAHNLHTAKQDPAVGGPDASVVSKRHLNHLSYTQIACFCNKFAPTMVCYTRPPPFWADTDLCLLKRSEKIMEHRKKWCVCPFWMTSDPDKTFSEVGGLSFSSHQLAQRFSRSKNRVTRFLITFWCKVMTSGDSR